MYPTGGRRPKGGPIRVPAFIGWRHLGHQASFSSPVCRIVSGLRYDTVATAQPIVSAISSLPRVALRPKVGD
jgi:hypothetical protein